MRLKRIRQILEETIPQLTYYTERFVVAGSTYTRLSSISELKKAILRLSEEGLFKKWTDLLLKSDIFKFTDEPINFPTHVADELTSAIDKMKDSAIDLKSILDQLVVEEKENVIYVKLPFVNDLNGLATCAETLNKILSQVVLEEEIGGAVKLESVENGSIWIELCVGTGKALALIGSLAYSAAFLYREYQKGMMMAETRRTRRLANDKMEMLLEYQKVLMDDLLESEAHKIENGYFSKSDPERILRIKNSINMLSDEMRKGLELIPSGKASEETAKNFPDMKELAKLMAPIKEILPQQGLEENGS